MAGPRDTGPGSGPVPITLAPSGPPPSPSRSRVPAIIGALVAAALGASVVLWATRSGDDERSTDSESSAASTDPADSIASDPLESAVESAVATTAERAPATSEPAPVATEVPLTLPVTVAPATSPAPETTAPSDPADPAEVVGVPAGAVPYADAAGWSISLDPAWQQSPGTAAWFTSTGSTEFQDNVNVAVEDLVSPRSLDEYVAAAIAQISGQAVDLEIVDQRRVVGTDGVEVEVIRWAGTFAGLPRLAFVQAVTMTTTRAYIATFTSQPDRMDALAPTVTPFLTTIRGT